MSSDRKTIKIISFCAFILFVLSTAIVVVGIVNHGAKAWTVSDIIYFVSYAISAILMLLGSINGIRGANRPSAIDPLNIICIVGMVSGVVWTLTSVLGYGGMGTNQFSQITSGVIEFLFFLSWRFAVKRVINERDNRI